MKITVATTIQAPISKVWNTYVTPSDINQWNTGSPDWQTTNAQVDLRVGGTFTSRMEAKDGSMGFDFAGTYTAITLHKYIAFRFGDREAQVEFLDTPQGVHVQVTFDAETTHSEELQKQGWQTILNNFAQHVMTKE